MKIADQCDERRPHPAPPPSGIRRQVLTFDIAGLGQAFAERRYNIDIRLRGTGVQKSDHPHRALLRTRREQPRSRTAEQSDELATPHTHSIISSASNCSELGTSMPSALAVGRLITNSNLVDCKTGRSAGLVPLRMRPVYAPA